MERYGKIEWEKGYSSMAKIQQSFGKVTLEEV